MVELVWSAKREKEGRGQVLHKEPKKRLYLPARKSVPQADEEERKEYQTNAGCSPQHDPAMCTSPELGAAPAPQVRAQAVQDPA